MPNKTVCRFFSQGQYCRYGSRCHFLHERVVVPIHTTVVEEQNNIDIPVNASKDIHPIFENSKKKENTATAADNDDVKMAAVNIATPTNQNVTMETNTENEHCCNICFENITDGFGLVSGCDHCFCLSCLRSWRYSKNNASDTTRQCPVCRVDINYVVPSNQFLIGDAKDVAIKCFYDKMAQKPCKNFKVGQLGTCPFGKECFYAHKNRNGEDMKANDFKKKQRPRFNFPTSIEHDLIMLSRLLNHRMNFPFPPYFYDEESGDDEDDYDGTGMMYFDYEDDVEEEDYDDDDEIDVDFSGDDDDEDDDDEEEDDESVPPLVL